MNSGNAYVDGAVGVIAQQIDSGNTDINNVFGFIMQIGKGIAAVVQTITNNDVGAFLIGLYVVATIFHTVVGKVRKG